MSIYPTELDLLRAMSVDDGGTDELRTTVSSSSLPTGAATEAKQDAVNASLTAIQASLNGTIAVTGAELDAINANTSGLSLTQGADTSGQKAVLVEGAVTTANPTYTTAKSNPLSLNTEGRLRTIDQDRYVTATGITTGTTDTQMDCNGLATVTATFQGTWTGTHTPSISQDGGVTWTNLAMTQDLLALDSVNYSSFAFNTTIKLNVAGFKLMRIRSVISSGTCDVYLVGSKVADLILSTNAPVRARGLAQASTTAGQRGDMAMAGVTTAAPSYTNAQLNPLSMNTAGGLRTSMTHINDVAVLTGNGVTGTGSLRVTLASNTSSNTNPLLFNQSQINGVALLAGNGVAGTGAQRVTIASDNTRNTNTFSTRSDTFTTTANGTTVDVSAKPMKNFSILVKATGAVTSWNVRLEVSNDNTNFTSILTHTESAPGDGLMMFSGTSISPCLYFRSRCDAISLGAGTNVVVTILGME